MTAATPETSRTAQFRAAAKAVINWVKTHPDTSFYCALPVVAGAAIATGFMAPQTALFIVSAREAVRLHAVIGTPSSTLSKNLSVAAVAQLTFAGAISPDPTFIVLPYLAGGIGVGSGMAAGGPQAMWQSYRELFNAPNSGLNAALTGLRTIFTTPPNSAKPS